MALRETLASQTSWAGLLALTYLAFSIIVIPLLAMMMPALQNSDESNHFRRVDQIARGGLVAHRIPRQPFGSGGVVDRGIDDVDAATSTLRRDPADASRKLTDTMRARVLTVPWAGPVERSFPNTSIYPPVLYLPAAIGVLIGRTTGLGIARTLIVSRLASGIVGSVLIAVAIAASGGAAPWLFLVAGLPMSFSLLGAVTQDGGMLVCAAWIVVLATSIGTCAETRRHRVEMGWMTVLLSLLATARPAYLPICGLPMLMPSVSLRRRATASAFALLAVASWSLFDAAHVMTNWPYRFGARPHAQILRLSEDPLLIFRLMANTTAKAQGMAHQSWWQEMIGVLGSLDVVLPAWFYCVAVPVLIVAWLMTLVSPQPRRSARQAGFMAMMLMACCILIFTLQYITVSPVGAPVVSNVQGRYFLPILMLVPLATPTVTPRLSISSAGRLLKSGRLSIAMFVGISVVIAIVSVSNRYLPR